MAKPTEHFHGSDLEKVEKLFHIKKEDIISFSANVNPLGISPKLRQTLTNHIDAIMTYPDRDYKSLRQAIGAYVKEDYHNIVVGNGSTELISLFIQIKRPKKALLLAPTYSEYEREIHLANGSCDYHFLDPQLDFSLDVNTLKEHLKNDIDLLVLCNPNNPTSTILSTAQIKEILTFCKEQDIFVIIDETYVEFVSNPEDVTAIPLAKDFCNLVVLRGISKFFAAPGLRLGYAICGSSALLDQMNEKKNPWTINSLAAVAGEIMFKDSQYIKNTRQLIQTERDRVCQIMSEWRYAKVYSPSANFILVKIERDNVSAGDLFRICMEQGLMIRDCSSFAGLGTAFFRFCLLTPDRNDRLLKTLSAYLE